MPKEPTEKPLKGRYLLGDTAQKVCGILTSEWAYNTLSKSALDALMEHQQNKSRLIEENSFYLPLDRYREEVTEYFLSKPEEDDRVLKLAPDHDDIIDGLDRLSNLLHSLGVTKRVEVVTLLAQMEAALYVHNLPFNPERLCTCMQGTAYNIPCDLCDAAASQYIKKNQIPLQFGGSNGY